MKVVHLSTVHTVADARIMQKEASALVNAGWHVSVVLPNDRDEVLEGVKVVAVKRPRRRLVRATLTALLVALKGLKENGDVYHFHDPELLPIGLLLRIMGKKVVYDVHETHSASISHRPYIPAPLRRPFSRIFQWLEQKAAARFTGIVAATPSIGDQFKELGKQMVVVQNFPQLDQERTARPRWPKPAPPTALYMGAMSEGRGVLTMVEAIGLLGRPSDARLILAGHMTPELRAKADRVSGHERVVFAGHVAKEQLEQFMDQASVGLVLFHPEPNNVAAFPTKMFEYMEAGLPVLASDFPLWRSIVVENGCGLVVDPLDSRAIAEALEYLMMHESESRAMGERGSALVWRHYNWSTERDKLVSFYEALQAERTVSRRSA